MFGDSKTVSDGPAWVKVGQCGRSSGANHLAQGNILDHAEQGVVVHCDGGLEVTSLSERAHVDLTTLSVGVVDFER